MSERDTTYHHEDGKRSTTCPRLAVDIREDTGHDRNGSTSKHSTEEAEDEEGGPVRGESAGHGEDAEHGEGADAQISTADVFTQGTPDDGAQHIAYQVDGYGEHFLLT